MDRLLATATMDNAAQTTAAGKGCDCKSKKMLFVAGASAGSTCKAGLSAFETGLCFWHNLLEELIVA